MTSDLPRFSPLINSLLEQKLRVYSSTVRGLDVEPRASLLGAVYRFSYALYANWLCIKAELDLPADSITAHYSHSPRSIMDIYAALCHIGSTRFVVSESPVWSRISRSAFCSSAHSQKKEIVLPEEVEQRVKMVKLTYDVSKKEEKLQSAPLVRSLHPKTLQQCD